MSSETTASFGAWCALKSSFPSDKDIYSLRGSPSFNPVLLLRKLSLPESDFSVFIIEELLLERYAAAVRSISRFFSSASAGVFTCLLEEFDWWNIMLLAKNAISRRDRGMFAEILFKPPSSTLMPPDISSSDGIIDMDSIINGYKDFFPLYARNTLSSAILTSEGYRFFEYLISALKLIRLRTASSDLDTKSRKDFSVHIQSGYKSLVSALPPSIPSYLTNTLTYLKNTIPHAVRNDPGTSLDSSRFDSPFARFSDLVETRNRINGFCASLGWMKHHVVS
ncbi:MAG TPA: hypothetical protein PKK43_09595 [Spirochaetota bacterium]|nr:hypothetical protein [Spirochaetota bacterium]